MSSILAGNCLQSVGGEAEGAGQPFPEIAALLRQRKDMPCLTAGKGFRALRDFRGDPAAASLLEEKCSCFLQAPEGDKVPRPPVVYLPQGQLDGAVPGLLVQPDQVPLPIPPGDGQRRQAVV